MPELVQIVKPAPVLEAVTTATGRTIMVKKGAQLAYSLQEIKDRGVPLWTAKLASVGYVPDKKYSETQKEDLNEAS